MNVQQYTFLFVGLSFSLYLVIAWRARVRDTGGFYVAGRGVPGELSKSMVLSLRRESWESMRGPCAIKS